MNMSMTKSEEAETVGQAQICAEAAGQPAPAARSLKQLQASRLNGQKSNGPVTPAGRAISRMNAIKHGILSKQVLVKGCHFKESGQELSALHERFWLELNPVGPMEELLVNQIVTTHWRWQRALRAESGEIALNVDEGQRNRKKTPMEMAQLWTGAAEPIQCMEESSSGLSLLASWLEQLRAAVEQQGELTQAALQSLLQNFGGTPNRLTLRLEQFRLKLQGNPEGLPEEALKARNKQRALALLNQQVCDYSRQKEACKKQEANMEESRQAAAVLPSRPVLDKILFYEQKLERQLYRAMAQLERLQRRRQGEAVPPPLTMEVSA
jgi:hypothetical protein